MVCSPGGKLLPTSAPRPTTFHGANHARGRIPADAHRSVGRTPALPCQCHLGSPLRILRRDSVVVHSVAELAWMVATRQQPAQLGQVFRSLIRTSWNLTHPQWLDSPRTSMSGNWTTTFRGNSSICTRAEGTGNGHGLLRYSHSFGQSLLSRSQWTFITFPIARFMPEAYLREVSEAVLPATRLCKAIRCCHEAVKPATHSHEQPRTRRPMAQPYTVLECSSTC